MQAILGILVVLAGVGLWAWAFFLALGEAVCEGQRPDECPDYSDWLIELMFLGGFGLAIIGAAVALHAVWTWIARWRRNRLV